MFATGLNDCGILNKCEWMNLEWMTNKKDILSM